MPYREILGAAAILLTVLAFLPYVKSVRQGHTRPHVFSWVVWGLTTSVVFFAQVAEGGGVGAWPIGLSAAVTFYIALLAWRWRGDTAITTVDWLFLLAALGALPLWYWTSEAFSAVLVLTIVDLLGFGPTYRKAFHAPREEQLKFYALMAVRNALAIGALERFTPATVLFPAAVGAACIIFIAMVALRRRMLTPS